VINSGTCLISLSTLEATPFSLVAGESVYVKVVANNLFGSSSNSTVGNGAYI